MAEEVSKSRKKRRMAIHAAIGGVILLAVVGIALYLTSASFQNRVRERVVVELEQISGGKVELAAFNWNLSKLEFVCENLTIHGLEPKGEAPYAHIDYLKVRLKILSVFRRAVDLRFVSAQRPVIHIIVNRDGTTNQPAPKNISTGENRVGVIFDLAIGHLEVSDGVLLWNDTRVPLNFQAEKVSAVMNYVQRDKYYDGKISVADSSAKIGGYRPLSSNAEVQFRMTSTGAEIKALHWASPASNLAASGGIANFAHPQVTLAYHGSIDAAELGAITNTPSLRSGKIAVEGNGTWSIEHFASLGRLTVKDFGYRDAFVDLTGVDASSAFTLNENQLKLTHMAGRVAGGTVQGDVEVKNWTNLSRKASAKGVQQGSANFRLNALDAGGVVAAVSNKSLPVEKLHVAGSATGTIDIAWTGMPSLAEAKIVMNITPPPRTPTGAMPVAAHFEGIYKLAQDQTQIQAFSVATLASRAIASGTLGKDATQLKLDFETRNLYEWGPMISAMSAGALPLDIRGRAAFKGLVYGKMATPSVRGTLDVTDFDSLLNLASLNERATNVGRALSGKGGKPKTISALFPAPTVMPPRIHWDSLHLDVDYSPASVSFENGLLRRGTAQVSVSGRSTLQAGRFTDASQFSLITAVENASFADVQSLAGTNYPVNGALTSNANLSGTINDIRGDGHILLTSGSLYGEPFKSLRADIEFLGGQAQAKNIALSQNGAQLVGTGAYNFNSKTFRFDVHGSNFDLAHLQRLQLHKLALKGVADFEATGSGTLDRPVVNAKLRIAQLVMNGERVGEITAEAVTVGDQLKLSARSKIVNADLHADGSVLLSGDFPSNLAVRFSNLDFDPLLRAYMGATPISGHSSANGSIDISGSLRYPSQWQIAGVIAEMSAEVEKIGLKNEGPIVFGMQNQVAELKQFHIQGDATDFQASGTAQLTGDRTLNGRAEGSLNLKLLQGFAPDMNSYGNTDLKMTITGTLSKPSVSGQVTIAQAGVSYADLPNGLTDINGTLTFTENRLHIQTLTAHTGGGTLDLGGFIGYRAGLQFDITAKGKDIRLRYPPGISAGANADLRYAGTPQNALLSGDVTVTRFGVNPRFDFASYLARSRQSATATQVNPMLDNLRLDVHIVSTPELRVETSLAKITGDVDLRVRGTAARPSVLGKVNITEGDIFFSSTKYHLERGDVTFTNPLRIEPVLNLEASARVREYDVTIGLHGSADNLSTSYRSDPPLSSADIIALLALGRTRDDTAPLGATPQTTQNLTETASNAVLGEALNAATSSRVQRLFGVSRIKIDPQVGGPENNPNARLTVEQQVNKNITLTYITNLAQSTQQIIQAEFTVNRSLSFVIVRDQNGVLGMDIRFRQRKR